MLDIRFQYVPLLNFFFKNIASRLILILRSQKNPKRKFLRKVMNPQVCLLSYLFVLLSTR